MDNLPPAPPALVQVKPISTQEITAMNGIPAWKAGSLRSRLVAICFDDGAGPSGWQQVPGFGELSCFRPMLTSEEGRAWQKRFDVTFLTPTPEPLLADKS